MELRSTVKVIRHFVHHVRQQTLFPSPAPSRHVCCVRNCAPGPLHQSQYFSSTSCFHGQNLVKPGCTGNVLASRAFISPQDVNSIAQCKGSVRTMAGHSKWANIRHIKAAKDTEKARVISEFSRRIRAFVRETGQTDPKTSSQLAKIIADAKSKNVPNANIERVLSQMTSLKNSSPIMLEAKGPGGSVMLIEAVTAKMKQTRTEVQSIVKKCGFSVFESSSLARIAFEEKGVIQVSCPGDTTPDMDSYLDIAIEAGAEDVTLEEDEEGSTVVQFVCDPGDMYAVKKELEARQLPVSTADIVYNCTSMVPLDSGTLELIAKAMDKLDEHPDILKVYINVQEAT